jgi:putative two-component system response regulator
MAISILIVDDEPGNIDLLKGIIPENVKVKAALKGEIAIKLCSKQMPDILFLDLIMPGLNGFETLQQIRALPGGQALPVVIISGNANPEDIEKGRSLKVIDHIAKPVQPEKVLSFIQQYF